MAEPAAGPSDADVQLQNAGTDDGLPEITRSIDRITLLGTADREYAV